MFLHRRIRSRGIAFALGIRQPAYSVCGLERPLIPPARVFVNDFFLEWMIFRSKQTLRSLEAGRQCPENKV